MNATRRTRPAVLLGTVAACLALTACSGMAEDAPRDAEPQAFCDTFYDRDLTATEVADALVEVGTPDDLSDEERQGFELWVESLDNRGSTPNENIKLEFPTDDRDVVDAFLAYVGDACLAAPPSATDSPTDAPSAGTSPSETTAP